MNRMPRRYGHFTVPNDNFCEERLSETFDILQHVVVLRAETIYMLNGIKYEAWSPLFDLLICGEMTPEYVFVFGDDGSLTAERVTRMSRGW